MMTVESSLKILSILIPVYNGEETIRDALEDLVRRGLNYRYEVIVCDDGSTDSSLREAQLVANQHCGISVVENGSHGEKVSAIKAGLQRITTPYVLLLDADSMIVELKNRYLDRLVEKMHARQWAAVGFKIQSSSNRLLESLQALEYSLATDSLRQTLGLVVCLSGAGVLWEADSLEKVLSRHTGVFEGDDLESTILATLLNLKIGYETQGVIVTTRPKRSLGALFKQRALIWDVGLIRALVDVRGLLKHKACYSAFFRGVLFTEVLAHPFKIMYMVGYFLLGLLALMTGSAHRCSLVHLLDFTSENILNVMRAANVLYLSLWILNMISIMVAVRPLPRMLLFVSYFSFYMISPLIFVFIRDPGQALGVAYLWWYGLCAFLILRRTESWKTKGRSLVLGLLMPFYFAFLLLVPRTVGFTRFVLGRIQGKYMSPVLSRQKPEW